MSNERLAATLMGSAMVLTPVVIVASYLLWPTMTTDGTLFVEESVALGNDRLVAGLLLGALGIPLAIGAFLGVLRLLDERGRRLGLIGASAAIVGAALFGGSTGAGAVLLEVAFAPMGIEDKARIAEGAMRGPGILIPLLGGQLLMAAGCLILSGGIYRSSLPRPAAYSLGGFSVVYLSAWATESLALVLVAMSLLALALIPLGIRLFRASETSLAAAREGSALPAAGLT
jgi:hypothetical protein